MTVSAPSSFLEVCFDTLATDQEQQLALFNMDLPGTIRMVIRRAFISIATLVLLIITLGFTSPLFAGGGAFIQPKGEGFLTLFGGTGSTENYYNIRGNLRKFDTVGTVFTATTFGLGYDYGITDALELNVELPIGYYSVTSETRFPDRSIFAPAYYGLGATYQLSGEGLHLSASTMLKAPPGYHRGIYDDPAHPTFLSDGYFQITSMVHTGFAEEGLWFKGGVGYNWRDEEPEDEIIYYAEVGSSKVEGAGIFAGIQGVVSMGDPSMPGRPFYAGSSATNPDDVRFNGGQGIFRTIEAESYLAVNAGAYVYVMDDLMVNGRYLVRLSGTNTLAIQGVYLGAGYHIR